MALNRLVNQFRPDPRTDEECNAELARRWGPFRYGHVHGGPGDNEPGAIVVSGCQLRVYRSDGSDGYSEGTYRYELTRVDADGNTRYPSRDGGYASRQLATEAGKRRAKEVA